MDNGEIAARLEKTADLLDVLGENPFRVRAYRNAARVIGGLAEPASAISVKELAELPNIGKDLAGKIEELGRTGSFPLLAELEETVPDGVVRIMSVAGVGPKRAKLFWDKLGVVTLGALERAAKDGKLRELKGIGEKLEAKIIEGCAAMADAPRGRMTIPEADESVRELLHRLRARDDVLEIDVAGSLRRRRETIGDVDVLVATEAPEAIAEAIASGADVREVLARGHTKCSVVLVSGVQIDVRLVEPESWGAALVYFTGSKAHNIALRAIALRRGLKVNEYGVFRGEERLAGRTEEDVYAALDLPWIAPELREDRGELGGALPALVRREDLRGDLRARARGDWSWVISDVARGAGVLRAAVLEVDAEGAVPAGGQDADVVIAAVGPSRGDATERVMRAMRDPRVQVIARATGKTPGGAGSPIDAPKVARAAKELGVIFEIDARTLDVPEGFARALRDAGAQVGLASFGEPYALDVARRGGCSSADVVNTLSLPALRERLR